MEITFYVLAGTDVGERLHTACRIISKAFQQKHNIYVHARDKAEAEQLDELLWTFRAESFIPHHLVGDGPTPPPHLSPAELIATMTACSMAQPESFPDARCDRFLPKRCLSSEC